MPPTLAELVLAIAARDDRGASTGTFLDIRASVSCRGFTGETAFCLATRDLAAFSADVAALGTGHVHSATLLGGWDMNEERLRLRVAPAGRSGRFTASVRIATNGPRTDQWQRVETDFVCQPAALRTFLTALEQLAGDGTPGRAALIGDPDAIS
jgi:hypothetical protein